MLFKIIWGIDAIGCCIMLFFFFLGLTDGTVTNKNLALWKLMVAVCAAVLGGSYWLRTHQHPGLALLVTLVLFLPVLAYLVFIIIGLNMKWQ